MDGGNLDYNYFEDSRWRFIGRDGSMGYRTGRKYHLGFIWSEGQGMTICRLGIWGILHGKGYTPYSSQDAFLKNWEQA